MVIRASFWSDAARGGDPKKFRESLCPAGLDVIPAFTLMEVELVCKVGFVLFIKLLQRK